MSKKSTMSNAHLREQNGKIERAGNPSDGLASQENDKQSAQEPSVNRAPKNSEHPSAQVPSHQPESGNRGGMNQTGVQKESSGLPLNPDGEKERLNLAEDQDGIDGKKGRAKRDNPYKDDPRYAADFDNSGYGGPGVGSDKG